MKEGERTGAGKCPMQKWGKELSGHKKTRGINSALRKIRPWPLLLKFQDYRPVAQ